MWYLLPIVGWIWYRKRMGLPILPEFLSGRHPFAAGATLIPTTKGIMAIPADTPVMHPATAASAGILSSSATMNLQQALAAAKVQIDQSAGAASLQGAWAMFDPKAGAGSDYRVDELGMPRSNSLASRPWGVR